MTTHRIPETMPATTQTRAMINIIKYSYSASQQGGIIRPLLHPNYCLRRYRLLCYQMWLVVCIHAMCSALTLSFYLASAIAMVPKAVSTMK